MSVFRSSLRLVPSIRAVVRTPAPVLSATVRHGGGGGPKPVSNFVEPNGFLFNEKVPSTVYKSKYFVAFESMLHFVCDY